MGYESPVARLGRTMAGAWCRYTPSFCYRLLAEYYTREDYDLSFTGGRDPV